MYGPFAADSVGYAIPVSCYTLLSSRGRTPAAGKYISQISVLTHSPCKIERERERECVTFFMFFCTNVSIYGLYQVL